MTRRLSEALPWFVGSVLVVLLMILMGAQLAHGAACGDIAKNPRTGRDDCTGTAAASAALPDEAVQFYESGVFAGDTGLRFDRGDVKLHVGFCDTPTEGIENEVLQLCGTHTGTDDIWMLLWNVPTYASLPTSGAIELIQGGAKRSDDSCWSTGYLGFGIADKATEQGALILSAEIGDCGHPPMDNFVVVNSTGFLGVNVDDFNADYGGLKVPIVPNPITIGPSASPIRIEGATDNTSELILAVVDPTADRTITFPNATGTVMLSASGTGSVVAPPTAQTIAAGNTISANGCGTFKEITSGGAVTTDTTNTFTAPDSANAGCILHVCNSGANNITLDNNALFQSAGGADVVMTGNDCVLVGTNGSVWYQLSALEAN